MNYTFQEEELFKKLLFWLKFSFAPSEKNDYRPKFLNSKILVYCIVLVLFIKIAAAGIFINFPQNIFFADITKITLENFVNQGREGAGLQPLVESQKLNQAAQLKAENMVQDNYFAHTSPQGVSPWHWFLQAGYSYKYAGENLAIGFLNSKEVFDAWLNSPSHKANILNPNYREVGTVILGGFGENKTVIVVQLFGSPKTIKELASPEKTTYKNTEQLNTNKEERPIITKNGQEPSNQFVLSQSTEVLDKTSQYFKYLNLITYDYERILQNIIYGFIAIIGAALLLNIFINFDIQRKDLILRALIIIIVLLAAGMIDKDIIAQIIPHKVLI